MKHCRREVRKPRGWKPFVENDDEFAWFCLTVRDSGIAGSRRLNIRDEVDAWALDAAVTHRLFLYDEMKMKNYRKAQAVDVLAARTDHLDWDD